LHFLRFIRANPFSVMALCNIVGDLGYLGFAFDTEGLVSVPKLAGAMFTIAAHVVLLAYGDDQAQRIAGERGVVSRVLLKLRLLAQRALSALPRNAQSFVRAKPIFVPFTMLALNGAGLLTDALLSSFSASMAAQIVLALFIIAGCGAFALADSAAKQNTANVLLKIAPTLLIGATLANACLALATLNGFVLFSVLAFLLSNYAGFYTKIDKKEPVSAGI
jgi:hypothetical protein